MATDEFMNLLLEEIKKIFKVQGDCIEKLAEHTAESALVIEKQEKQIKDLQNSVADLYLTGTESKN